VADPATASTQAVIWDTSVVIDPPAESADIVAISIVTVLELIAGVNAATGGVERASRLALLAAVLSTFDPLPVDRGVSESYVEVDAAVRAVGRQSRRRLADLEIAATAAANGLTLITRNPADFVGLEDVVTVIEAPPGRG
jgi:predicted nucleic acid-binding protein